MNKSAQLDPYLNQKKIEELESIRGLAALLIVFYHFPKWSSLLDVGIINNGYLMVDLFFVLSGFVIYSAYANKISSSKDLLRFQFLRFGRLYPVHLTFFLVLLLIEIAKYFAQIKFGLISPNTQPFRENNPMAMIEQIFLIQAIGPNENALSFNGPSWSISVEFYTYLIFGISILLLNKIKDVWFSVIAVAAVVLVATQKTFGLELLLRCLAGFFIGCLTAVVIDKFKINVSRYISLLVFASIILFLQFKPSHHYDLVIYLLTAVLIASIVLSRKGYLNNLLNLKALTWLGSISYALYMSHTAIIWFINQFLRFFLKKPEIMSKGKSISSLNEVETVITFLVATSIILIVSAIVYNFIEKPMRAKSRQFAFSKLS